jgi:hypothetical protein
MISESDSMLDAAIRYAARGWHVFPCWWITDGACSCGRQCRSPGKHPMTSDGFKSATTDPDRIRECWTRFPNANIGIRTGPESGLWVLDVDGEEGVRQLKELESMYGPLPRTLVVETGGGGRHYYFS